MGHLSPNYTNVTQLTVNEPQYDKNNKMSQGAPSLSGVLAVRSVSNQGGKTEETLIRLN